MYGEKEVSQQIKKEKILEALALRRLFISNGAHFRNHATTFR